VIVPLAWVVAAMARWLCRNVRFSDGTTASFRGTGGGVVGWILLSVLLTICHFGFAVATGEDFGVLLVGSLLVVCLHCAIGLQILKWCCSHVDLSGGPPLKLAGGLGAYIGWYILVTVSFYTIIGWAWATAALCRWICGNVQGAGIAFSWAGKGHQVLWRVLVCALASCLIIPIPWVSIWLMQWMVEQVAMQRGAARMAAVV
jgi:hypothetical protein